MNLYNKTMPILKIAVLSIFCFCLFLGSTSLVQAKSLNEVIQSKVLRVGIPGDYEPFAFPDKSGKLVGHDIDAALAIGEALGVKVEFVKSSWPTLTQDLLADKFDMAVGGVTRTNARQIDGLLSDTVYYFGKSLIIRKADQEKFTTLEQVNQASVTVGINPGGTNEKFARAFLTNTKIVVIDDNMAIPFLVADGTVDIMVSENVEVRKYVQKDDRLGGAFVENTLTKDTGGYFFKKEDRELLDFVNMWLSNARINGQIDALYEKWIK